MGCVKIKNLKKGKLQEASQLQDYEAAAVIRPGVAKKVSDGSLDRQTARKRTRRKSGLVFDRGVQAAPWRPLHLPGDSVAIPKLL